MSAYETTAERQLADKDKRIDELEAALRWYIAHVEDCEGTDFLSAYHAESPENGPHVDVVRAFRKRQY